MSRNRGQILSQDIYWKKKKKEPAQEGRKEEKREERRKKEEWKNIFILIANLQRNPHLSLSSIALIMLHFLLLL